VLIFGGEFRARDRHEARLLTRRIHGQPDEF
jgi:hypothetical protein